MRVKCSCDSSLFFFHVPHSDKFKQVGNKRIKIRAGVPKRDRATYLICNGCRTVWNIHFDTMLGVDRETGILNKEGKKKDG